MKKTIVTFFLPLCITLACKQVAFSGSHSHSHADSDSDAPSDKATEGRPKDDSEGVPGYLTDPPHISIQFDQDKQKVQISAPPGEVMADNGPPNAVRVYVFQSTSSEQAKVITAQGNSIRIKGIQQGILTPQADGALAGEVPFPYSGTIVLATLPSGSTTEILLQPSPENKYIAASKEVASMDTVAAVRLLPQPLWSATEISQEAARIQNDAQQDHYTSLIDAAEISSFVTCMVTAAAKRWNFDVYSQSIGSNLALLNQDGTRGICLSAATSIDSDKPEAAQAKGGWTQRQVDIELAYCSATTKNSAVCPCQVNVLSKNWSYVYIRLLSDVHYAAFMTSDAQLKACQ